MRSLTASLALPLVLLPTACRSADPPEEVPPGAPAPLEGYHRLVSTRSPGAQRWFDRGLQLLYGFDRAEAARSFEEAARADPDCAMAWWGVAVANGPHLDDPRMTDARWRAAHDAARKALRCLPASMPVERALVRAAAERTAWPPPDDRAALDRAYAEAMERVWREYASDPDVGALFADALMHARRAPETEPVLEEVLALDPLHPGANHVLVHVVEAVPGAAQRVALPLARPLPDGGHPVPPHVYARVGRYGDAADAKERAITADRASFELSSPPDFYRLHFLHDVHFVAYAAMMEARPKAALEAARALADELPPELLRTHVQVADGLASTALHVRVRFGLWEEILEEPEPPPWRPLSRAMRRYARGLALCALGRAEEAAAELEAFDADAVGVTDGWFVGRNPAAAIVPVARGLLLGELRWREGRAEEALAVLRDAVRREDALALDEPPGWLQPVRHTLGAHLVSAGRFAEAERVYRADLERHPENGWSLLGLEQALRGLDRIEEAAAVAERCAIAWERAEVRPTSSCAGDGGSSRPAPDRATRS